MWICQNNAFLSIVAHRTEPDQLLVRARVKGHIEAVFPTAKVFEDGKADYQYRAILPRQAVVEVLAYEVSQIRYTNFKNSVKDKALHDAYLGFWGIMYRLQGTLLAKLRRPTQPTFRGLDTDQKRSKPPTKKQMA